MDVITTKYLGPTNTRGSSIKAQCKGLGVSVTCGYQSDLNSYENHREAAIKLIHKMGWVGDFIAGELDKGYVWVLVRNWNKPDILSADSSPV